MPRSRSPMPTTNGRCRPVFRSLDPGPLRTPGEGPRSLHPPCRGDLRGRREHLRPGPQDAAAGAHAGHSAEGQVRDALRGMVGREQRMLPDDLDDERHADRRARIVPRHRRREVPDQPPLPRCQPRGACRRDPRAAHPRVHRGQSAPLGGRPARGMHAPLRGGDGSNCSANVRCGSSRRESRPTRCSRATTSRSYYKVRR